MKQVRLPSERVWRMKPFRTSQETLKPINNGLVFFNVSSVPGLHSREYMPRFAHMLDPGDRRT
jgi:hypothetical protein